MFDRPILSVFTTVRLDSRVFSYSALWCDHAYRIRRRRREFQDCFGSADKGKAHSGACNNAAARSSGAPFRFCGPREIGRAAGSAIHYTTDINSQATLEAVAAAAPDLSLVIGWSQVCRRPFRDVARAGTVGFHPAALPRLRGRGVIPWTILRGEERTGSTLFWLDDGIDSGPILLQRQFPVAPDETARSLYTRHTENLAEMVVEAAAQVEAGNAAHTEQNEAEASYCAKRTAEDGRIDWHDPAASILRLIRAVGDPYPGAFTFYKGQKIRIDAATPVEDPGDISA